MNKSIVLTSGFLSLLVLAASAVWIWPSPAPAAGATVFSSSLHQPRPPKQYTELMPESSPEFSRTHITDGAGLELEIRIVYRNGNRAVLLLAASGKVREERLTGIAGNLLKEAKFAADGKTVVSGFERRASDGSLLWKTESYDNGNIVSTEVFQRDGSVFARIKQDVSAKTRQATFFYANGQPMIEQEFKDKVLLSQKVMSPAGKLSQWMVQDQREPSVSYYRADGSLEFKQIFSIDYNYVYRDYSEEMAVASTTVSLKSVELYSADGKTLLKRINSRRNWGSTELLWDVEHLNRNGSGVRHILNGDGSVSRIVKFDRKGNEISNVAVTKGTKELYDQRYYVPLPSGNEPFKDFLKAERDGSGNGF